VASRKLSFHSAIGAALSARHRDAGFIDLALQKGSIFPPLWLLLNEIAHQFADNL